MAFTRVQGTTKASAFADNFTISMGSLPTVGNAIIILIFNYTGSSAPAGPAAFDNQGNPYKVITVSNDKAWVVFCPYVYFSSGTFTITIRNLSFADHVYNAIEIAGGGPAGIQVDQQLTATGTSASPAVGPTGSLTNNNIFAVAVHGIATGQASIAVSAGWTQEIEDLSKPGEADYQILTTASGSTLSVTWTDASSAAWGAMIVAFAPAGSAGGGGAVSYAFG
jgi:hypothetical protein